MDRAAALAGVLRELQEQHGPLAVSRGVSPRVVSRRPEADALPPWWGDRLPDGHRLVELAGPASCGKLSLALLWLAAADRSGIVAVVDTARTFYPPAAAAAGLDLDLLVIVRPPDGREAAHAVTSLVVAAGFDAVLWPIDYIRRPTSALSVKLARFASRSRTRVLSLLERPRGAGWWGISTADVRLAVADHRWRMIDGELAGVDLTVRAERVRGQALPDWRFELRTGADRPKIAASGVCEKRVARANVHEVTTSRVATAT